MFVFSIEPCLYKVCPNNMKTPYFKMIIPYFIHFSFNSYHAYCIHIYTSNKLQIYAV